MELLYKDHPEMRTFHLIRTLSVVPATYKTTPEMRTPPLIRTLSAVPRVSGIEIFHGIILRLQYAEFSLEFCKDIGVGEIWEELLTISKHLCSTYLKTMYTYVLQELQLLSNSLRTLAPPSFSTLYKKNEGVWQNLSSE